MEKSPYRDGLPGHRRNAPETSREAAEYIAPVANSIRAKVRAVVDNAGPTGIIADEIADRLDLSVYQVRARVAELHTGKLIADSGRRGRGLSGRRAAVWVAKQYAPEPAEVDNGEHA